MLSGNNPEIRWDSTSMNLRRAAVDYSNEDCLAHERRPFPSSEYEKMLGSLSRYATKVESAVCGEKKELELALLLDALEAVSHGPNWSNADTIHHLLVECIVLRRGEVSFAEEVVDMLSATQAYEIARGNVPG
jgi:hypothetical protein